MGKFRKSKFILENEPNLSFVITFTDRFYAFLICMSKSNTKLISETEPRSIGKISTGRQIVEGKINFLGQVIQKTDEVWNFKTTERDFYNKLHSFDWVDDLAALGSVEARRFAQSWLFSWIKKYRSGFGPGWTPELTGRRLVRWVHHYLFLTQGCSETNLKKFNLLLARQAKFLSKRAMRAPEGLPRFEALLGLIYAGCYLENMEKFIEPATIALANECHTLINGEEIISSRNAQEVLNIFTILIWAKLALKDLNWNPSVTHLETIEKLGPILRNLRHSDAGLPRFHGSCGDVDGQLDQALSNAESREISSIEMSIGFAKLSNSRTTVIIDAAPPPMGKKAVRADASTLAFEMVSGQRRIFTSCGPGYIFGSDLSYASRKTSSHCTVYIDDQDSSKFSDTKDWLQAPKKVIIKGPRTVPKEISNTSGISIFEGAHDGYVQSYGLTHVRKLMLSQDGQTLEGEDLMIAIEDSQKKLFEKTSKKNNSDKLSLKAAFHLHPNVVPRLDQESNLLSLALKNGEVWMFNYGSDLNLELKPTIFFETGLFEPVESKKLVLSTNFSDYGTRIKWSLAKAIDKDLSVGDLF
jgi:uncharacterized heparinase superfamily protein